MTKKTRIDIDQELADIHSRMAGLRALAHQHEYSNGWEVVEVLARDCIRSASAIELLLPRLASCDGPEPYDDASDARAPEVRS